MSSRTLRRVLRSSSSVSTGRFAGCGPSRRRAALSARRPDAAWAVVYPVTVHPKAEAGLVEVIVEIPRGSRNKYEFDKARGVFVLDRVLYSSVHYPTDYGYVADTLAEDGDA